MGVKMKLKKSYETDLFISRAGYYVIDQTADEFGGKVLLTRDQVNQIVKDMEMQLTHDDWEEEFGE